LQGVACPKNFPRLPQYNSIIFLFCGGARMPKEHRTLPEEHCTLLTPRQLVEISVRAIIVLVLLFNALAPTLTVAAASALPKNSKAASAITAIKNTYKSPSLTNPTPRYGQRTQTSSPQSDNATILCTNSWCTQSSSGIVLTETLNYYKHWTIYDYSQTENGFNFQIQCGAVNCNRNVYYIISGTLSWGDELRSPIVDAGADSWGVWGTGHRTIDCSPQTAGSCNIYAKGVVSSYYFPGQFEVGGAIEAGGLTNQDDEWKKYTIEVSLDPRLLSNKLLNDSTVCKDCSTQAQAFAGDPINTYSGVFSYPIDDLSFATSAGQIDFKQTYVSLSSGETTSSMGYGWRHNQDIRLIFSSASNGVPGFCALPKRERESPAVLG